MDDHSINMPVAKHLESELIEKEDLVAHKDDDSKIGEVVQVGWENNDFSDSDDEMLEDNEIRVTWQGDDESEILKTEDIIVTDKTFIIGNLVALKTSRIQSGIITDLSITVDLKFLSGKYLSDVPFYKLQSLFECEADFVYKEDSMGSITAQTEFLKIQFGKNPREFWINADNVERHEECNRSLPSEVGSFFYGQKIYILDMDDLYNNYHTDSKKRKKTKRKVANKLPRTATVLDIVIDTIDINWFLLQNLNIGLSETMNVNDINIVKNPSRLRKVNLGQRVIVKDEYKDTIDEYLNTDKTITYKKKSSRQSRNREKWLKLIEGFPACGLVVNIKSSYQITWQDGSISNNIRSLDVVGYDSSGVKEFWPTSIVCRAPDGVTENEIDHNTWGVVESTNVDQGMVNVKWITNNGEHLKEPLMESISVYSLVSYEKLDEICPEKLVILNNDGNCKFTDIVGEVQTLQNGICTVWWLNGSIKDVYLDEVTILDDEITCDDGDDDFDFDSFDDSDNESEENESEEILNDPCKESSEDQIKFNVDNECKQSESIKDKPSYPALNTFDRFSSVEQAPINHHFIEQSTKLSTKTLKAIFKDWALLQSNLPEGVFVRSFDSNMDLLQVLIIGPRNTPYHDSVFVFDVGFPYDYPKSPPAFYYHSVTGEQINPNLYTDGAICLSLLGTWHGEGVEVWDSTKSSVLQVILSIQGLILGTEEPYYLEAGFDKRKGSSIGDVHSLRYNPTAILGTLKHSLKTNNIIKEEMSLYTKDINDIIQCHLQRSSKDTIQRIENYLKFVSTNKNPTTKQLLPLFNVPLEGSEGFNYELQRILKIFKTQFP